MKRQWISSVCKKIAIIMYKYHLFLWPNIFLCNFEKSYFSETENKKKIYSKNQMFPYDKGELILYILQYKCMYIYTEEIMQSNIKWWKGFREID